MDYVVRRLAAEPPSRYQTRQKSIEKETDEKLRSSSVSLSRSNGGVMYILGVIYCQKKFSVLEYEVYSQRTGTFLMT